MSEKSIQILLVDDHAIVREGYRSLLQKQPNLTVIADARDAAEAYQNYKTFEPDVVIMDISMPGQSGLEAISRIRQYDGQARILVFQLCITGDSSWCTGVCHQKQRSDFVNTWNLSGL